MDDKDRDDPEKDAGSSKLQAFRGAFRRAQEFLLMKLGRPVSENSDSSPNGARNPERSGTKRLPSNQEIQEAMHDYNYPDLTLLEPEINRLPPPPDISTLPKRHPKRKQALRNGKRTDYSMGKRSFSVPGMNDRSQQVQFPRQRTNVSMKARLFERMDSDNESEEYLYPKPSPKQVQKRFIPPNSKPALVPKPTRGKTGDVFRKPSASISSNRSGNVRGFLPSNSPKPFEFPNATPRPWKPSAQKQISNIHSPPEYVDMGTPENIPVNSKTEQSVANVKLRPVGKVVGNIAPTSTKESEDHQITSDKLFHELSVVELVACLQKCGLKEMAEVCQSEKLDGSFISQLSPEELQELNLSPIQVMKLNKVKSGWRPKTSQFS